MRNTKVTVIPDMHGCNHWKTVIGKETESDYFVSLGDWFDSFDLPYDE